MKKVISDKKIKLLYKEFVLKREAYQVLCQKISSTLKKQLNIYGIEFSSITYRCKTFDSFLNKVYRKNYSAPFSQISDIGGIRIVFLYKNDLEAIKRIILYSCNVIEEVDKQNNLGDDKFGYSAFHCIVHDEAMDLKCEIQIRTILQDSWALIAHHLTYKHEFEVPINLQRMLNSIAGMLESADTQFEIIKDLKKEHVKQLSEKTRNLGLLGSDITLQTFELYISWKFPLDQLEAFTGQMGTIYNAIKVAGYCTLNDIDIIVEKYLPILTNMKKDIDFFHISELNKLPRIPPHRVEYQWSGALIVGYLLAIENNKLRTIANFSEELNFIFSKHYKVFAS